MPLAFGMCDTVDEDTLMREELSSRYGSSDTAFFNMLQDLMPYQQPDAHTQVNEIINKALEEPGHVTVLTLIGPHNSGKSMTCQTLKWGIVFGKDQMININTRLLSYVGGYEDLMGYERRHRKLSLAQRLMDAAAGDPSIILLIIDDVHVASPALIHDMKSLLVDGNTHTPNGAYFTLSPKTSLVVVFTCTEETELTPLMGHIIPYHSPRYGNQ